ncbi:MAG: MMPL family transporter, partial [Mycobacteriaceae bacterium]|nr:MMPL family transporter [Mycobacteriaceae bacterium]
MPAWTPDIDIGKPGDPGHRSSRLARILIVVGWIAVALVANVTLALTHPAAGDTRSALPAHDAPAAAANNRLAQAFPGTGTDAIAYLVLDGRDQAGDADRQYYEDAIRALRADTAHVGSVLDWWSDPLTAPLGTGPNGRSGAAMIWLRGQASTAKAAESLESVRSVVRNLPPDSGQRARIAVPPGVQGTPLRLAPWQAALIVVVAALIAAGFLWRLGLSSVAMVALTAGLSVAVTWPLAALFGLFTWTVAAVLMIGVIVAAALLLATRDRV